MRNEERCVLLRAAPAAGEVGGGARRVQERQRLRGVAGQLRPYCDVRAGFEPWRRVALMAWAARDEALTVN